MAPRRADDLLAGYPVSEGVFDEGVLPRRTCRARTRAPASRPSPARDPADLPESRRAARCKRAGVRFSSVEGDLAVLRRPRPARDHRRRLGAGQARPRPARARAERLRRRRLRRAADRRRGRRPARGHRVRRLLRAGAARRASRRAASGSASPASTSSATTTASGSCSRTTSARRAGSPTCTPRGARCSSTSPSRPTRRRARSTARSTCSPTPCAPSRPRAPAAAARPLAAVLTDGEHNSAYWEHAWLSRQLGIPLIEPRRARGPRRRAVAACRAACATHGGST